MIKKVLLAGAIALSAFAFADSARANQYVMNFSVTDFFNQAPTGVPVPTDPVTGTIVYEASGIQAPIRSFDSVNLTIDGHSYSAADVGFYRFATPSWDMIGGLINGVGAMGNETDDFSIRWYRDALTPFDFAYVSSLRNGIFVSAIFYNPNCFTTFTITEVPEPEISALLTLCTATFLIRIRMSRKGEECGRLA
jgi:hypothetical protein